MSKPSDSNTTRLEDLVRSVFPEGRLLKATALKPDVDLASGTHKGTGYGSPIKLEIACGDRVSTLVLHTATANEFGHDRRSDRAEEMLLAADSFELLGRHVRVADVGAYKKDGGFVSLRETGEFYLLTDWAEGSPYAEDLRAVSEYGRATPRDLTRAHALADYLSDLHREKLDEPLAYTRSIRDLVGGGEGVFGIADAYPDDAAGVSRERLLAIQTQCVTWRERLKRRTHRLRRIHGDYHPFNILFDSQGELLLLDTSRGSAGDPADDLAALSVNYLFFGLERPSAWAEGFRPLWYRFWSAYQASLRDDELGDVIAPFFAWRCLVLACPRWYPDSNGKTRDSLLGFAERLLASQEPFRPELAEELFR